MKPKKVAILTAGGLAPCLSSAIGALIERYTEIDPSIEIICYRSGYKGLLLGDSVKVTTAIREKCHILHGYGGSPIGNSRVKLTNVADCIKRGLVKEGEDPQEVAARQMIKDGVDVLHTIGGDDTNITAADLAAFLEKNNYDLTVIGLPKTIDNDVYPIRQSLGAWTAAEHGSINFTNVVAEHNANPRMLIVHEVMGRNCGWLTAATARHYQDGLEKREWLPEIGLSKERFSVNGVYIPEMAVDFDTEITRLLKIMDEHDSVNLFISEGAGVDDILRAMEAAGQTVVRDAFGHVKLDTINPGAYFAKEFALRLNAEKTLIQKSGYYSRAAASNHADQRLIKGCVDLAVECAMRREGGVIGHDEDQNNTLRAIEFSRIKGGKPFDIDTPWFEDLLARIGQSKGKKVEVAH